jgi:multiple sugar transport system ATP-binding protein
MAKVILEHVEKIYDNGLKVVKDLSLEIADGELLVLVGPSGCGKSTTLRMIAGLEEITEGVIRIDDRVVNHVEPKDRDIAMVFQDYALYPHMTVFENMAFGLRLRKCGKAEIEQRVKEAADILGLNEFLQRRPKALSGGQRQRVALGRAIVRKPAVFLFDEPLSNLDAKMRVQMRVEIAQLHNRLNTTMIYVTHDQVEAMTLGERIVVMKDGIVQQVADPISLYDAPVNRFVAGFIGTPPMNFFEGQLVRRGNALVFESTKAGMLLPVPQARAERLAAFEGKPIGLGFRPEDMGSAAAEALADAPRLRAKVNVIEPMGSETYVYLLTGGTQFVARMEAHKRFRPGDAVEVPVNMNKAHFFDAQTEERIGS